jgi:3,4-dihydroxy 2-butanone 4-phosphate synthase/GTP cyclohydrolase II
MMTTDMQRVVDAVRAFERGEIVVVTDDDDRENEGDLILAAEHATSEKVAFIIRHTSGIVCAPVTRDAARSPTRMPAPAISSARVTSSR